MKSVEASSLLSCLEACKLLFYERAEKRGTDAEQICECEDGSDVEYRDTKDDAKVAPVVRIFHVEGVEQELVSCASGAVFALGGRIGVLEVAADDRNERSEVLLASVAAWRFDPGEFLLRANNLGSADRLRNEALNQICERRDTIHPLPPSEFAERL